METNRYNFTKIYKIVDIINDYFYIGSTTNLLSKRLSEHKNKSNYDSRPIYYHFKKFGWENAKIILIEEHNLENRNQQLREEDRVLQLHKNDPNV